MSLNWSIALETGFKEIDDDHKKLIEELNKLGNLLLHNQATTGELRAVLRFLGGYAQQHFAREEACMSRHRCPHEAANKAAHAQFVKVYTDARLRIEAGLDKGEAQRLHKELCEWVRNHILRIDTSLRACAKVPTPS